MLACLESLIKKKEKKTATAENRRKRTKKNKLFNWHFGTDKIESQKGSKNHESQNRREKNH